MVKANLSFHDALSMPIGILSIEHVKEVFISCKVFVVACYPINLILKMLIAYLQTLPQKKGG